MRRFVRFLLPVGLLAALAFPLAASADHGNADEASPNMLHVANLTPPPQFLVGSPNETRVNSDLAFPGAGKTHSRFPYLPSQGNYVCFRLVNISDPSNPLAVSVG